MKRIEDLLRLEYCVIFKQYGLPSLAKEFYFFCNDKHGYFLFNSKNAIKYATEEGIRDIINFIFPIYSEEQLRFLYEELAMEDTPQYTNINELAQMVVKQLHENESMIIDIVSNRFINKFRDFINEK